MDKDIVGIDNKDKTQAAIMLLMTKELNWWVIGLTVFAIAEILIGLYGSSYLFAVINVSLKKEVPLTLIWFVTTIPYSLCLAPLLPLGIGLFISRRAIIKAVHIKTLTIISVVFFMHSVLLIFLSGVGKNAVSLFVYIVFMLLHLAVPLSLIFYLERPHVKKLFD